MLLKRMFVLFVVGFVLSGCGVQSNVDDANADRSGSQIVQEQDASFAKVARETIVSASETMAELENGLRELQATDDLHEAQELMEFARQELLYHWNRLRNERQPESERFKQLKMELENLLMDYREGLSLELAGMSAGDPIMMKKGFDLTEKTRTAFVQLKRELADHLSNEKNPL